MTPELMELGPSVRHSRETGVGERGTEGSKREEGKPQILFPRHPRNPRGSSGSQGWTYQSYQVALRQGGAAVKEEQTLSPSLKG